MQPSPEAIDNGLLLMELLLIGFFILVGVISVVVRVKQDLSRRKRPRYWSGTMDSISEQVHICQVGRKWQYTDNAEVRGCLYASLIGLIIFFLGSLMMLGNQIGLGGLTIK
jgi:hypothetical protein